MWRYLIACPSVVAMGSFVVSRIANIPLGRIAIRVSMGSGGIALAAAGLFYLIDRFDTNNDVSTRGFRFLFAFVTPIVYAIALGMYWITIIVLYVGETYVPRIVSGFIRFLN